MHDFRNYYQSGWGEQRGQMLSPKALETFFRFLEAANFPAKKTPPSVFLTDRGGIELSWEDADQKSLQAEFTREHVEFYREATGEEGSASHDEVVELSRRLKANQPALGQQGNCTGVPPAAPAELLCALVSICPTHFERMRP